MNNKNNLKIYYEDSNGICVYDSQTKIGISIDEYTHNVPSYCAEIIPVFFNDDFSDNEVIEIFEHLRTNKPTFTQQGYCDFEHRVNTYYDDDTYETFRTDDGFVCEIPKSFWEYGMSSEKGSDRLDTCADYLDVLHDVLRESRIALCKERAEDIVDEKEIAGEDLKMSSEDFADYIVDALEKEFVSFKDVMDFNYKSIEKAYSDLPSPSDDVVVGDVFITIEAVDDEFVVFRTMYGEEDRFKTYPLLVLARAYADGLKTSTELTFGCECPIVDETVNGD